MHSLYTSPWTAEEDEQLRSYVNLCGAHSWKVVAAKAFQQEAAALATLASLAAGGGRPVLKARKTLDGSPAKVRVCPVFAESLDPHPGCAAGSSRTGHCSKRLSVPPIIAHSFNSPFPKPPPRAQSRSGKECRDRWYDLNNHKRPWTDEEDERLLRLVAEHGKEKMARIAASEMTDRTLEQVRRSCADDREATSCSE